MTDDNVTPIVPSHVCASCKATIETRNVYEGHGPTCMQPEVRIRRLERQVVELKDAHNHLVDVVTELLRSVTGNPNSIILESNGTSESPDTQRSGSPILAPGDGLSERTIASLACPDPWGSAEAAYACGAHADASAAESERPPAAGAEPAREEPGRA